MSERDKEIRDFDFKRLSPCRHQQSRLRETFKFKCNRKLINLVKQDGILNSEHNQPRLRCLADEKVNTHVNNFL